MEITLEDALSLLTKWRGENRLIQSTLVLSELTNASVIGRITELSPECARITNAKPHEGLMFNPSDAHELSFQDWRDAPAEHAEQLQEAYEGFIFLRFRDGHCEVYAAKTPDELPPI